MKKIAVIFMLFSIIGCDNVLNENKGQLSLSGFVFVSLNGRAKRYSRLRIYSDSALTKPIGLADVYNSSGHMDINDYTWSPFYPAPDGAWIVYIRDKIDTPIKKVWIKITSHTYGSESKIIEYPLFLYDKSIAGINLGLAELPGTRITMTIGNNITYNGVSVSPEGLVGVFRILSEEIKPAHLDGRQIGYILLDPARTTFSFDTGVINDTDRIFIIISAKGGGIEQTEITGAELKAGYTWDNIVLNYNI